MKKIELHLHLDGSCNIELASQLEGKDVSNELIASNTDSLSKYLESFTLPIKLLQDLDNIENFSYLLAKELEKDEVIYAEVRFCPLFHIEKYSIEEVVHSIIKGFNKVSTVKINLIFCMMRDFSEDDNMKIIMLTKEFLGKGVVAIDLAGDEAKFKTSNFDKLFDEIKKKNIPFTIHAGEADSYESVQTAISFGTKRIGHGVRCIEDKEVMQDLKDRKVLLEICPTSNFQTQAVTGKTDGSYPIEKIFRFGIPVGLNTDNDTVSNTDIEQEYAWVLSETSLTTSNLIQMNLDSIKSAFTTPEKKLAIANQIVAEAKNIPNNTAPSKNVTTTHDDTDHENR